MNAFTKFITIGALALTIAAPVTAEAQRRGRERTRSEWQKLSYAGAALGLLGQLNRDKTLSYLGAAGGAYSLYRWNEDNKAIHRRRDRDETMYVHRAYGRHWHWERVRHHRHGRTWYTRVKVYD